MIAVSIPSLSLGIDFLIMTSLAKLMLAGDAVTKATTIMILMVCRIIRTGQGTTSSQGLKVMCLTNPLFSLMAAMLTIRIGLNILEHEMRSMMRDVRRFSQQLGSTSLC
jgi:hypothetical protein